MRSSLFIVCLFGVILPISTIVAAQGASTSKLEDLLVAAHFYAISYTRWPERSDLRVCITKGHRLMGGLKLTFESRQIGDLKLKVVELSENPDVATACDVAIVGDKESENRQIFDQAKGRPILTVSSEVDITDTGGMIFLPKGKPPRILLSIVNSSGLKIDSALLAISEIVQE